MTIGPLLKGRKTRLTDGFPVTRLVRFEQAVAHQKRDGRFHVRNSAASSRSAKGLTRVLGGAVGSITNRIDAPLPEQVTCLSKISPRSTEPILLETAQ